MNKLILTLSIALTLLSSSVLAADNRYQQFNTDTTKAYSEYRIALFQTNKDNADKSANAVKSFLEQWQTILQNYETNPPEIFSSDAKWAKTLKRIDEVARTSLQQIDEKKLKEAHETLEVIRDELSQLRKRNSVIIFSDHVNNYHKVMEELFGKTLSQDQLTPELQNSVREQLAVLTYLANNIKENAPQEYVTNKKFITLQEGLFDSLDSLDQALQKGNPGEIKKSIKMLKPAYAKLFLNFG